MTNNPFYGGVARALSLLSASTLTLLILLYPGAVASDPAQIRHGLLAIMLWGIAAGYVHGVGYIPKLAAWRILLGPLVGLPVMTASMVWLVSGR
jgi:cyd operon protein YbgE